MTLSFKEVSEILKIIDSSNCEEIVLELDNTKLIIRRGNTGNKDGHSEHEKENTSNLLENRIEDKNVVTNQKQVINQTIDNPIKGTQVLAPMVGTFYRRPSPDQPNFIEINTKVEPGTPLCLIEVMKLYTTIEADTSGIIKEIFVDDGQLVEFDQLLFIIEDS